MTADRFESPKPSSLFAGINREARTPFEDTPLRLDDARRRAERVITNDDSFFDVRGARVPKSSIGETIREFDDEVFYNIIVAKTDVKWQYCLNFQFKSTLNKIRANKAKAANFADDLDFEDTVESFKRRGRAAVSDFDSAVDDSFAKSAKKSSYKVSNLRSVDLL